MELDRNSTDWLKNRMMDCLVNDYSTREIHAMYRWILDAYKTSVKEYSSSSITPSTSADFEGDHRIIERLIQSEPLAYILGETEFFSLPFKVTATVLIPRPETEELVEWILSRENHRTSASVLDIGTGSGCIAIALKKHRFDWRLSGMDISEEALEIANENADLNCVHVDWLARDIRQYRSSQLMDVIVSNPPYIPIKEQEVMSKSTLQYEPAIALFTKGDDGMDYYRSIALFASTSLSGDGVLYFEINEFRAAAVEEILHKNGFRSEIKQDLQGKDRMIRATRR